MRKYNTSKETGTGTDNSRFQMSTRRAALKSIAGVASLCTGTLLISDRNSASISPNYITTGKVVKFKNLHSGKFLEIAGVNTGDGANVQQWSSNNGLQQKWKAFDYAATGQYIESMLSGKVLQVSNGSTNNGANIEVADFTGDDHQLWTYDPAGQFLMNKKSGKVLEIGGWGTDNGDNAIQWEWFGSNENQQWELIFP